MNRNHIYARLSMAANARLAARRSLDPAWRSAWVAMARADIASARAWNASDRANRLLHAAASLR